jgi:hypothetical protein
VIWVGGGDAGAEQDPVTPTTPTFTGNGTAETGVPGATFTVNVNVFPPTNVTVTVH